MVKSKGRKRGNGFYKHINTASRVANTAYTALKIAKGVASLVNAEYKYHDDDYLFTADDSGLIEFMSGITEGDDNTQRNGRSVRAKSLFLTGSVAQHASATETIVRIIVFRDKANQGFAPTVLDVLKSADVASPLNVDYAGNRFQILRDVRRQFSNSGTKICWIKEYIELNSHLTYIGTTGAVIDSATNALYMLAISNETTNQPGFELHSRIQFIDN